MTDQWKGPALPWTGSLASLLSVKNDEDVLATDLVWLIFTSKGERYMQPDLGCDARKLVFSENRNATPERFLQAVKNAVSAFDDRIEVVDAKYVISNNTLNLTLSFTRTDQKGSLNVQTIQQSFSLQTAGAVT